MEAQIRADKDQSDQDSDPSCSVRISVLFYITPVVVVLTFSYVNEWYTLFGVSAIYTTMATLFYLASVGKYNKLGPDPNGSPLTDIFRVLAAAAFKIFQQFPQDDTQLHRRDGDEFQQFSPSTVLGFLNKAAIILPGEDATKNSWRLCSVSQVEAVKRIFRMVPMCAPFIVFGIVSSAGNTYFVEQATHLDTRIGKFKTPTQPLLLIVPAVKIYIKGIASAWIGRGMYGVTFLGMQGAVMSVLCCTVAAAVERRRLHVLRRHGMADLPDSTKVPMSAYWLLFQMAFLSGVDTYSESTLSEFHMNETPKSMTPYQDCFSQAVTGLGFITSSLSVYVVGKISEVGSARNWFQPTLNRSRLDRYYGLLSVLTTLNLIATACIIWRYSRKKSTDEINQNLENVSQKSNLIEETSAYGLLRTHLMPR